MMLQQPSELPQPQTTRPDQLFGEYTFEYFIQDNMWYILGFIIILVIVIGYSRYAKRKKDQVEN